MEIKLLPKEINEQFRSHTNINSLSQCVLELIFNSLDAKATAIATRVNIAKHEVQVIDNGVGVSLTDLQNLGIRYMTSKFESLHSFENKYKHYGYKGEFLASIICISKKINIKTRYYKDTYTYSKTFENGSFVNIVPVSSRSSQGTTVTVNEFLFNCPVKQRRIKSNLDLNNIKVILKSLAIIHPKVSFSLRDNSTGKTLLDCYKTQTVSKSLCALYDDITPHDLLIIKVAKDNINVSGLIYTKSYKNCKPQLIYVNKRPVNNDRIEKHVNDTLSKIFNNTIAESNHVFVINIGCPYTEVDISFEIGNVLVEFKSWKVVMKCIDKMIKLFGEKYGKVSFQKELNKMGNKEDEIINVNDRKKKCINKTHLKSESLNISSKKTKKTNIVMPLKVLNNLKKYPKTLGLKKSKLKLRKRKHSMFEETIDLSDLSFTLQEVPSIKPLKREKLETNPVYLKNIFDDEFDSQNLIFDKNFNLAKQSTSQKHLSESEIKGKEFVMDLFLNSLTPPVCENNTFQNKEYKLKIINEIQETPNNEVTYQKSSITEEVVENNRNTSKNSDSRASKNNDKSQDNIHISFNNDDQIKKRRIEKLNKIGTTLIKDKLSLAKSINYESKSIQTSFTMENTKKDIRNSTTSTNTNKKREFKRFNSENKSIQTSFLRENDRSKEHVGLRIRQNSNIRDLSQKFEIQKEQVPQILDKIDQNSTQSLTRETNSYKFVQNQLLDCGNTRFSIQNKNISNEITFVSHYKPKFILEDLQKTGNTSIEINTRNVIDNLNKTLFSRTNDNYKCFKEGLEINKVDFVQNADFTLNFVNPCNEQDMNTSKYFNNRNIIKKRSSLQMDFDENKLKNNCSILVDTSRFLQERICGDTTILDKPDYFDFLNHKRTFNEEVQNDTELTFQKFMPAYKSTQKDPKYCGKVYNFFESFAFDDCRSMQQREGVLDTTLSIYFQKSKIKHEWSQKLDNIGNNYYVNKRTGMTTYNTLNKESNFSMKKRADFIPKGLSPILKEVEPLNVSLSPTSKKQLNNAIIESYESELDLVKWQEYLDNEDPQIFFNKLYEEKRKQMEQIIPCIEDVCLRNVKKVYSPDESFTFTKDIFKTLDVLGQMDNKFIVALSSFTLVILLDQHAVHERIRVENLLQDYTIRNADQIIFKSGECKDCITIKYTPTELQLLNSFKSQFENIGVFFDVYSSYIKINKIPLCFIKKCANNAILEENMYKFVSNLINDELMVIQNTRGIFSNIPKIIQYVINNEACRGAIKFGRKLSYNECTKYVTDLSKCQLPFQCAHGRPTLFPLLEISDTSKYKNVSYNLKRILK